MVDLNNSDVIDPSNPGEYGPLLDNLQGNILKSHGRDRSAHLFIKFTGLQSDVKQWIQDFANEYVTSASLQAQEAVHYRKTKQSGSIFANFFLSAKGYEYLGTPDDKLPVNPSFRLGMKNDEIRKLLSDLPLDTAEPDKQWDAPLKEEIHALVLLADDDVDLLQSIVNTVCQSLSNIANLLQQEDGFILRNNGQVIEHFGFADGISQPIFVTSDLDRALENSGGSFDKWDPKAPLSLVLEEDPYAQAGEDSYGSYLVYRKLEQNVQAFREDQRNLATELGIEENLDLAGALIVGRFQDGTPVVESEIATGPTQTNNFDYDEDPQNMIFKPTKCPFHAHIRKSNPRGDTARVASSIDPEQDKATERGHRIARRAISYGINDPAAEPVTGSGLLFLCFQANPDNQFNFIQAKWANKKDFVDVNVGLDPVIGQPAGTGINQTWPKTWGGNPMTTEQVKYNFDLWVTMKGGEYFFAPSMSFLRNITTISFEEIM